MKRLEDCLGTVGTVGFCCYDIDGSCCGVVQQCWHREWGKEEEGVGLGGREEKRGEEATKRKWL